MSTSIDVMCERCTHPLRAHGFIGSAQRGPCKAEIHIAQVYETAPGVGVESYSYPCDCPQPSYASN